MKRILTMVVAMLLLAGIALAQEAGDGYIGDMTVVNCSEYVSLREEPSKKADRLAKVWLGDLVTNCHWYNDEFIWCEYADLSGYILAEYLEPAGNTALAYGVTVLDETLEGYHVTADRNSVGEGELLTVRCEDASGAELWSIASDTSYSTELTLTDAFIAGPAQDPVVMVYNAEKGLSALDIVSGAVRWTLTRDDVGLGASNSYAVTDDGTIYIGGYYGPDPVAIGFDGTVLWQADCESNDVFWLYELEVKDGVLAAHYDYCYDGASGWLYYDLSTGAMLGWERDE